MSKEFNRGIRIGQASEERDAVQAAEQPEAIGVYETGEEDTKALLLANEEDFIQGLIDAAGFVSAETQRIEIVREGRLFFASLAGASDVTMVAGCFLPSASGLSAQRSMRSAAESIRSMCAISSSA